MISKLPAGSVRDEIATILISSVLDHSPEHAFALALQIQDAARRAQTAQRSGIRWLISDKKGTAQESVQKSNLPDKVKEQIFKCLPKQTK